MLTRVHTDRSFDKSGRCPVCDGLCRMNITVNDVDGKSVRGDVENIGMWEGGGEEKGGKRGDDVCLPEYLFTAGKLRVCT